MVIDFSADWCGPCKFIEPAVHDLAIEFSDVEFIKIDVDELPEVAKDFEVQAMPTFVLVKKGKERERIVGVKKDELHRMIEKHRTMYSQTLVMSANILLSSNVHANI
nr:thioredoxin H2 [Tanacetum cinerariifolium]